MKRLFALGVLITLFLIGSPGLAGFALFQVHSLTYSGISATRAAVNQGSLDTTNKQLMTRSGHFARSTITSIKIIASNFYVDLGTQLETGSGATATVTASVEYPAGVCTQLLFSASASGSISDGSTLESDVVNVSIPSGAQFWIRQFWTSTGGTIYSGFPPGGDATNMGDSLRVAVSGLTDQTVSCGTVTKNVNDSLHWPLAIISRITAPSVCIIGDSIAAGTGDDYSASGDLGSVARSIGSSFGYTNLAIPSSRADEFVSSHTQMVKVLPFCTAGIIEYGTNDLSSGHSVAQLESDLTTIYGYFSVGSQIFQTTILPRPSTSNGCTTLGGQTLPTWEANRLTFNDALKGGSFGPVSGQFDLSSAVETAVDSGFWITSPRYSIDCIHGNQAGYLHIQSSGVIDTSRIHR